MRKMIFRVYVDFLRLEDIFRRYAFYFKVVRFVIEIYLKLYDDFLISES